MPITLDILSKISFDEDGNIQPLSRTDLYDDAAQFLFDDLNSIVQNKRLFSIATGFYEFYFDLVAPNVETS